jgi:hypothetical protein
MQVGGICKLIPHLFSFMWTFWVNNVGTTDYNAFITSCKFLSQLGQ